MQLITPTGDRPRAWALCERWMARQTYAGPVVWHVVDDGVLPLSAAFTRDGWDVRVHRLAPMPENTQARNMMHLLRLVTPQHPVVVIEDDDWYAPDWLDTCAREIRSAECVGEAPARYYNVARRVARQLQNGAHASLCATAVRGHAVETLRRACEGRRTFIDLELWRRHHSRRVFGGRRVVGIKGLPGRGGIGMGHDARFAGKPDPDGAVLRSWVGADAEAYLHGN